jgi:hypothetical protein
MVRVDGVISTTAGDGVCKGEVSLLLCGISKNSWRPRITEKRTRINVVANGTLKREAFTTSRLLEFFTEKELTMQIAQHKRLWPLALLKELIDNCLDACETSGVTPWVTVLSILTR